MKRNTKYLYLAFFLVLAVFVNKNVVEAASKSKNAKKIYKKYMESIYEKKNSNPTRVKMIGLAVYILPLWIYQVIKYLN